MTEEGLAGSGRELRLLRKNPQRYEAQPGLPVRYPLLSSVPEIGEDDESKQFIDFLEHQENTSTTLAGDQRSFIVPRAVVHPANIGPVATIFGRPAPYGRDLGQLAEYFTTDRANTRPTVP